MSFSSAEAGYYGIIKAASVGLGVQSLFKDLNLNLELEVITDASAAKGVASLAPPIVRLPNGLSLCVRDQPFL